MTMKIAASDYDGTLYVDGRVDPEEIAAITRWRSAGNIFGLATGRDLSLTVYETDRWGIPFDFLVCLNGATVYDRDRKNLQSIDIPDEIMPDLLGHPAIRQSLFYQLCAEGLLYLHVNGEEIPPLPHRPPTAMVSFEESLRVKKIQQVAMIYQDAEECEQCAAALRKSFENVLSPQRNGRALDVTRQGVDKSTGIATVAALSGWSENELLAVGDNLNDIPMLRRFRGFAVERAEDAVKREAAAVCASVGQMLDSNR